MTNNYKRGRKLEYAVRDEFTAKGYIVIRSAGSKGLFDLCAISPTDVVLVQVKAKGAMRKADLKQLQAIQVPRNVRKEIWEKIPYKGWEVTQVKDDRS